MHNRVANTCPGLSAALVFFAVSIWGLDIPPEPQNNKRLKWYYETTVDSYLQHGERSPAWDQEAVLGLYYLSRAWGGDKARIEYWEALEPLKAAWGKGCEDPLVQYAYTNMYTQAVSSDDPIVERLYIEAAGRMQQSEHVPIRRIWALMRGASCARYSRRGHRGKVSPFMYAALRILPDMMENKDTPPDQVLDTCETMISQLRWVVKDRKKAYDLVYPIVEKARGGDGVALCLSAAFHIRWAWDARGGGWASSVTDEGWRLFGERLNTAEKLLREAWETGPKFSYIPGKMITVGMGLGKNDAWMRRCIDTALEANPDDYHSCNTYVYALTPKWGGSTRELLDFARWCVQYVEENPGTNEDIAMIMVDGHELLIEDWVRGGQEEEDYMKQPHVWPDLSRAFELVISRRPKNRFYRSLYARWCCKAGKWQKADELFRGLGSNVVGRAFDNRREMEEMREHAASEATDNKTDAEVRALW